MGDVVDINANKPHHSGPAMCLECRHKWVAVVLAEDEQWGFECPSCGVAKGVWDGLVRPPGRYACVFADM